MALVASPLPVATVGVGMRVVYYDPTADMAGQKFGWVKTVTRGASGTDEPITLTVTPEAGGADVTGAARFFRVVDDLVDTPAKANV